MTLLDVALLPHWSDALVVIATTLVLAVIARQLLVFAINRLVKVSSDRAARHREEKPTRSGRWLEQAGLASERSRQRTATLGSLLKSMATFIIAVIAIMTIMGVLGVPMGPLLTSAGVLGVALGFGAQSLVKDFLSGLFMIVEDQYGVGDFVDVGTVSGTVEEVTMRVIRLRDPSGLVWYIPNGEIKRVGNHSQGWSTAMIDVPIDYNEDTAKALAVLHEVADTFDESEEFADVLLEKPSVLGVDSIKGGTIVLRMMIKCQPNQHWAAQRELREDAKAALAKAGIRGPQGGPYDEAD